MKKVLELLDKIKELKGVEKKKREMREAFVREFGIEPERVTVDKATGVVRDGKPVEIAEDILLDLGCYPESVEIELTVRRCYSEEEKKLETDWQLVNYGIGISKYSNGFNYKLLIDWEECDP